MKEMTFIAFVYDKTGKSIDFQRWNYKRASTVARKMQELAERIPEYKGKKCYIYATPNGYDHEVSPMIMLTL